MSVMTIDLRESWWIGPVEIPTRLVLAPMAGVSVQAFRRAGAAVRSRARLLRDGQQRRHRASQRAHARLPPGRGGRAPARHSALRLEPGGDERVGANGGRGRRRHRGHQLRLPGAQGDQDRRRARRCSSSPDLACRIVAAVAEAVDVPVTREDAPRAARRLARLPRRRAAPGRRRSGLAHAPPALGAADVHRHAPTMR